MTGTFLLDWATLGVSLFNTILLLWLGLTVLLNAERRTWGIWLAGGGLLAGGLFFVSHSAILGHGPAGIVGRGVDVWWHVGWAPVVALPFAWYVLMLWYTGYWDAHGTDLRRRQCPWLILATILATGLMGLLIFALPSFLQVIQLDLASPLALGNVPLLILAYPLYVILCIVLSVNALRQPGPSTRAMGHLARRRARPWLLAASVALLAASLLVALVMGWIASNARQTAARGYTELAAGVAWFDLAIASLIAGAVVLLGQAIISYEVFTGKNLPRRGFFRHWRRAVILAAGYGAVVGGSLTLHLLPIYNLLLTVAIMVAFYALLVWRSFVDRERYIAHLRPFVSSQRLYDHLLAPSATQADVDAERLFRALCRDVLGTRTAYMTALGPLGPLAGPPLAFPDHQATPPAPLAEIVSHFTSPQTMGVALDPGRHGGAAWAVPLWSERGLIGVLLLGEKREGGFYTQEEIEIARASGERLIDTQASAEMARRLMALQRQRLTESQMIDQRTRRVLHDEVLPRLHAALLTVSADTASPETVPLLTETHRQIADLLRDMPAAATPEVARLGLVDALRQTVESELGNAFDAVVWDIEPAAQEKASTLPAITTEALFCAAREAARNAARHGRGRRGDTDHRLSLNVTIQHRDGLRITVEDDGIGIGAKEQTEATTGQGLALHSTMMAIVGGTLEVSSEPGTYTRVTLRVPG